MRHFISATQPAVRCSSFVGKLSIVLQFGQNRLPPPPSTISFLTDLSAWRLGIFVKIGVQKSLRFWSVQIKLCLHCAVKVPGVLEGNNAVVKFVSSVTVCTRYDVVAETRRVRRFIERRFYTSLLVSTSSPLSLSVTPAVS